MHLNIEINCNGAHLSEVLEHAELNVSEILSEVQFTNQQSQSGGVWDVNGNRVGSWEFIELPTPPPAAPDPWMKPTLPGEDPFVV